MVTDKEHLRQADHNQAFLAEVDKTRFPDWFVTVAFYKAVHLAQSLFAVAQLACKSHGKRNSLLRSRYPEVWKNYQPLYAYSRLSRYWCMNVKSEDLVYIERRLRRIEASINSARAACITKGSSQP